MSDNNEGKNTNISISDNNQDSQSSAQGLNSNNLMDLDALSSYLKADAGTRQGRSIPPLDQWHPEQTVDMDLVIKANGEWWHEGGLMSRESLVTLFATVLWQEQQEGHTEYFLKTPVQKMRIQVEDVPLLINDVGIVKETVDGAQLSWLEFTTTTGDVVRLDEAHPITLRTYEPSLDQQEDSQAQIRPYMPVRDGLTALIGRNTFYHLTEIGELTEANGKTVLTLSSGGQNYQMSMPEG